VLFLFDLIELDRSGNGVSRTASKPALIVDRLGTLLSQVNLCRQFF